MNIRKELCMDHPLPDGRCQVVISVRHLGRRYDVATSVFIFPINWDESVSRLSANEEDHQFKNEMIDWEYRRVCGKIQSYVDTVLDKSLERLMEESATAQDDENVADLLNAKMESVRALNTKRGYNVLLTFLKNNGLDKTPLCSINRDFTNNFIRALDTAYNRKEPMRRLMIARLNAVLNFGKESGMIRFPLKITLPTFPCIKGNRNLTDRELRAIFRAYEKAIRNDPKIQYPQTMALGLFVLDFAFQGLAPSDLADLRVGDLDFRKIHNDDSDSPEIEYLYTVCFRTVRKKTGMPVHIVTSLIGIGGFIERLIINKRKEDYLLSCFNSKQIYSPAQRQNRLSNYFNRMSRHLNRALDCIPEISCRVTYYFARHAFCNAADNLDIPRHLIQHLVGHKSSVLETNYLRGITPWEQAKLSHALLSKYLQKNV